MVCEKISKTNFQDGGCGGHPGFLIDTILAHFDPEVVLLLQSKFQLKSTKGSGRDVENGFTRWRLWRPSWIFYLLSFIYFMSTRCADAPHQVSTQFDQILARTCKSITRAQIESQLVDFSAVRATGYCAFFNLYHSLGKFSRRQIDYIFLFSPENTRL